MMWLNWKININEEPVNMCLNKKPAKNQADKIMKNNYIKSSMFQTKALNQRQITMCSDSTNTWSLWFHNYNPESWPRGIMECVLLNYFHEHYILHKNLLKCVHIWNHRNARIYVNEYLQCVKQKDLKKEISCVHLQ